MSQVTVTAKTMGAQQVTAKIISGITKISFDLEKGMLRIYGDSLSDLGSNYTEYSLTGVTTITDSISSGVHTWVVS